MMIYQFQWFGKMITIRHHDFRIVFLQWYYNRFIAGQRIDISPIYNGSYLQKTQQSIVFPGNNNMIPGSDKFEV